MTAIASPPFERRADRFRRRPAPLTIIVRRYLVELGLTPVSRSELGVNVTRAGEALRAHLSERYAASDDDGGPEGRR